jgi:hypothetical protein
MAWIERDESIAHDIITARRLFFSDMQLAFSTQALRATWTERKWGHASLAKEIGQQYEGLEVKWSFVWTLSLSASKQVNADADAYADAKGQGSLPICLSMSTQSHALHAACDKALVM